MDDINCSYYKGRFEYKKFDYEIPEGHFSRFTVAFINSIVKIFNMEKETFSVNKRGRKGYSFSKMASLIYYAYANGFTHASTIADFAANHTYYKYVANGITPNEDTINRFIDKWGDFFDFVLSYTVLFAKIAGFTEYENVNVDSTYSKSTNNRFNVIHKDDLEILIRYYSSLNIDDEELDDLRYPAKRFMNRTDMTNKKKLEHLNKIYQRFDETNANTIPINDIDSIHLHNKQGNADVGYNIQTAVDEMSKMFMAIIVSQKADDHNQFPSIITKAIENMKEKPGTACADAGYNTRSSLEFVEENNLNALIDNNRDSKIRNGHKNKNPFHKDNMVYDFDEDNFTCYNNAKLNYQKTNIKWDDKKEDFKIQRVYYNKKACENCKHVEKCCSTKYRTIIVNNGILALEMQRKFQDYPNILKYIKRFSTVEAPNGTLLRFFHINEFLTIGKIKMQHQLDICGGAYNLIRIYKQLQEKTGLTPENFVKETEKLCKTTNALKIIQRTENPIFIPEKIELPSICTSFLEKNKQYSLLKENNAQTKLIKTTT